MRPYHIGVIGCGNVCLLYLDNFNRLFQGAKLYACADLDRERACRCAEQYGIAHVYTVDELLADEAVDVVLNLTIPAAHYDITRRALEAGKHVYSEKPLALEVAQGRELTALARKRGLRLGCSPDTVLGGAVQTARHLIDSGEIGRPLNLICCFTSRGPEWWHPNPALFYKKGAGPLFDMGPYYLTEMITLIGSGVRSVCAQAAISMPERYFSSPHMDNGSIRPEIPTLLTAALEFDNGVLGTFLCTFDVWHSTLPLFEVHGETGSICAPDANYFFGDTRLRRAGDDAWKTVPPQFPYARGAAKDDSARGLGLCEMLTALEAGRPHRASGELALHVLEVMQAIYDSARERRYITIETKITAPAPMHPGDSF